MNEIRVKRMLLAGLAMLVVWVAVEVLVEQVIARILFGQSSQEMWLQIIEPRDWRSLNLGKQLHRPFELHASDLALRLTAPDVRGRKEDSAHHQRIWRHLGVLYVHQFDQPGPVPSSARFDRGSLRGHRIPDRDDGRRGGI